MMVQILLKHLSTVIFKVQKRYFGHEATVLDDRPQGKTDDLDNLVGVPVP